MSEKTCNRCAKLEAELAETKRRLEEERTERRRLERLLQAVHGYCLHQAHTAAGEMSKGGLGAARYSKLQGISILASDILSVLGEPGYETIKKGGRHGKSKRRQRTHSRNRGVSHVLRDLFNAFKRIWRYI